jgi:hypothetical protein
LRSLLLASLLVLAAPAAHAATFNVSAINVGALCTGLTAASVRAALSLCLQRFGVNIPQAAWTVLPAPTCRTTHIVTSSSPKTKVYAHQTAMPLPPGCAG